MAVRISLGKRSYSIVWHVGKIEPRASNAFILEDSRWCLVLETEFNAHNNEEDWKMYLRKIHPKEGNHVFFIIIYLQDKNRKLECLNFSRLAVSKPGTDQILWRRKSNVLLNFPDLKLDGDVSFLITLLSDHRYMSDVENYTDSKQVQTPSYMEINPCMESLSADFHELAVSGSGPDVELHCGGRVLHAHKAVLTARSEVFAAMLHNDMQEKNRGSVEIVDVEHTVLEHFLRYLYSGTLPDMNVDLATGLFEAADKYAVLALKTRCCRFLTEHLTTDNACNLLVLADTHSDDDLKESITAFIIRNDVLMHMKEGHTFCTLYPKLAVDVLYRAYKITKATSKSLK